MPKLENHHLPEGVLHELLDGELAPSARVEALAHIEACSTCLDRMAKLQAVFSALGDLPDEELERDLTPGILAGLRPDSRAVPWLRWLLLLQSLVIIVIGVGARSGLGNAFEQRIGAPLTVVLRTGLAWLSGQLVSLWISITTSLDTLLGASAALLKRPRVPIAAPEILSLILAGMVLLWLIGNGLLLRGVRPLLRSGTPRD